MKWTDIQKLVPAPGKAPDFQACLAAFPALELAKLAPQNPEHHAEGNVWIHTMLVVEALVAMPAYALLSRRDQEIVFLAALLHDIAKYSTTKVDPVTGAISQPGHSQKGAVDVRIALWDAGAPFDVREAICRLIAVHQVPFFAVKGSRSGKTPEFIVRELSWHLDIPLLAMLAEADIRGRICADREAILDRIEAFRDQARKEDCFGKPRHFADAHTRLSYFRGANVHPDYALYQEAGSQVTMMSGLQAVGKNTWVAKNAPGLPVVSFDDALAQLGLRHGKNDGKAAHLAVDLARELLRKKAPFVWNATHLSPMMRKKTLDLLLKYNAEVRIVYLEQPRDVIMRRNTRRDTTLTNKGIEKMLFHWEVPLPTEAHSVTYLA